MFKQQNNHLTSKIGVSLLLLLLIGCANHAGAPMKTITNLDTQRFMGTWYVLANIPTFAERDAINPMEKYRLNDDGTVDITFSFNTRENPTNEKQLSMKGFVNSLPNNGIWQVQFIWPFKADYRIAYIDQDYQTTIIARQKRDYLWIMSRSPNIDEARYEQLVKQARQLGYDGQKIQRTSWQASPLLTK